MCCSLVCVLSVVSVAWSVSVVSVCYPLLCVCSLIMCVYCMCLICVACICYWSVCLCVFSVSAYCGLLAVSVCPCVCVLYACVLYVCVSVCLYVCIPYLLCMYSCSVFVLLVTLLVWRLSWWCDGRLFLGLVVLVFWWVWRVWIFLFFYSRFLVGGRLLLGFCYRTFFCGFPWGLCRARNFFKDITHSYCGFVSPVMSLYMPLLAYLYHTLYCVDTAPVSCLCPCLSLLVLYLCFVLCCPDIAPTCACIMF